MDKIMNTEREKKVHAPLTGRRYASVDELMAGESVAHEVRAAVAELDKETMIVHNLIQMRHAAGLTQQQLADLLGKNQSAISKLESSADAEITLDELRAYSQATNEQIILCVGKPMNHVESVKWHAFGIKDHLSALAKMAHGDGDMEQAIQAFFGQAFFNILTILSKCQNEMPNSEDVQVRMKNVGNNAQKQTPMKQKETVAA
jgi:transcriptional regulator with XRE-family HTH domain